MMELMIGDCTFQGRFDKIGFTPNGRVTCGFKPPKGQKFVVLLIGTVDNKARQFDVDAALSELGFIPKEPTND